MISQSGPQEIVEGVSTCDDVATSSKDGYEAPTSSKDGYDNAGLNTSLSRNKEDNEMNR